MIQRKHKDLFERLLQDMARLLAEIMGKHTDQHLVALQEAREYYLQLNEEELLNLQADDIVAYLLDKAFNHAKLMVTAQFLEAEAKVCIRETKYPLARLKLDQTIALFEYLEANDEVYSQARRDTLAELKAIEVG